MMTTTNLYLLYKNVSARIRPERSRKSLATESKALAMVNAARELIDKPSLAAVARFKKTELAWLQSPDVGASAKAVAPRFEAAIRSGDYVIDHPHVNRAQTGWVAHEGIIYCVTTPSKPGQVKIGATTMNLKTRLQKLRNRYGYGQLLIQFAVETDHLSDVEDYAHSILESNRVTGWVKGDSLEWFRVDTKTALAAVSAAAVKFQAKTRRLKISDGVV